MLSPRSDPSSKGSAYIVNLEEGRPLCDQAIRHLTAELHQARRSRTPVLKLIHGYGSSGTGGRIRVETRRYLDTCMCQGLIEGYITGENFSIFDEKTQKALIRFPFLSNDRDLQRFNNGITVVLVKLNKP